MDNLEDTKPHRLFEVDDTRTYTGGLQSDEAQANRNFVIVIIIGLVLFVIAKLSGM